jgi:hypothetical protein
MYYNLPRVQVSKQTQGDVIFIELVFFNIYIILGGYHFGYQFYWYSLILLEKPKLKPTLFWVFIRYLINTSFNLLY